MPKLTPLEELQTALRLAAEDADSGKTSHEVAEEFYAEQRELIANVADQWIIEKIASLIRKFRAKIRRDANRQLTLEGILGFKHLPRRIELKPGEVVRRSDATVSVFRKLVSHLRKKESPSLQEAQAALELMRRYAKHGARDITWAEVVELEGAKAEAEAAAKKKK